MVSAHSHGMESPPQKKHVAIPARAARVLVCYPITKLFGQSETPTVGEQPGMGFKCRRGTSTAVVQGLRLRMFANHPDS